MVFFNCNYHAKIEMKRIRVAGIIPMEDGFVFMHRKNVTKNKDYQEYYTFPGRRIRRRRNIRRMRYKRNKRRIWNKC